MVTNNTQQRMPVESLTPTSNDAEIQKAMEDSIAMCVEAGQPQPQCQAMVNEMVKKITMKSNTRLGTAQAFANNAAGGPGGMMGSKPPM